MEPQNPNNIPEQPIAPQVPQQPIAPANTAQPPQAPANFAPQTVPQPVAPAQAAPLNSNVQNPLQKPPSQLTEQAERLKKISIQVMIVGLIGAASVAVIAVLAGSFNDTFQKALFTLLLVVVHALACLGFVEQTGKPKQTSFKFFENVVFFIIVLSFFTSIFGVWKLIDASVVGKLYGTYMIMIFASLHGQMLVETRGKQSNIDTIIDVNYVLMGLVILLLLPIIWTTDAHFPGFYYRILAACGIIDGTLTILAVILNRLYVQKHPGAQSVLFGVATSLDANGNPVAPVPAAEQKRHIHPLIWLLAIFMVGQIVVSLLFAVLGAFYRR